MPDVNLLVDYVIKRFAIPNAWCRQLTAKYLNILILAPNSGYIYLLNDNLHFSYTGSANSVSYLYEASLRLLANKVLELGDDLLFKLIHSVGLHLKNEPQK